jgi:hypothetical protein
LNITLLPHQEKAIEAAINAGVIHSVEELIDSAIAHLPPAIAPSTRAAQAANLVDLLEPIRGVFTDEEIDAMFKRNPSSARPVDLE